MKSKRVSVIMSSATTDPFSIEIPKKPPNKTASEHRKATKPIMEKRRRARINGCLNELKGLILDALNKDPSRSSKLEKADILEMTVKHLQNLQSQQLAAAISKDPTVSSKFRAGFSECASEVTRYISKIDGVDPGLRQRLMGHLKHCVNNLNAVSVPATTNPFAAAAAGIAFPGMLPPGIGPHFGSNTPLQVQIPIPASAITANLFPTPSSNATINLSAEVSDINNNPAVRNDSSQMRPPVSFDEKMKAVSVASTITSTPPASATSTASFMFAFPPHASMFNQVNHSPNTPSTPSTPSSSKNLSVSINQESPHFLGPSSSASVASLQSVSPAFRSKYPSWKIEPDFRPRGEDVTSLSSRSSCSLSPCKSENSDVDMAMDCRSQPSTTVTVSMSVSHNCNNNMNSSKTSIESNSDVWRPW